MNFRNISITLLTFCLILNLEAKQIDLSEAEKVARNFIFITANKYSSGCTYDKIRLTGPFIYKVGEMPVFYAFGEDPGFIIISADDAFTPVLGYSFEGSFDFDNSPENYKSFILHFVEQIQYLQENQLPPSPEIEAAWTELRNDDVANLSISRERDVAPLLSCIWNQGAPFNIYCPADPAGPGGHVWVGCVATAMAQIMYYWRYPETGTGQHCYNAGIYGQQCANFGQTTYNWSAMKNGIDNRYPDANAELQYHCAVSVNMNFSPDGSGAYSFNVPGAINQYFRYNNAVYEEKQNYSFTGWVSLLKADIDAGKPLYYSGYSTSAGHAFVCDGYQGENFHFNFGWSGQSNGYYTLYDVGGFNQGQACVRNFAPSDPNYPYYNTGTRTMTGRSGSITDGSGPVENYRNNSTAYWLIDPQTIYDSITNITLAFSQFDILPGDTLKVFDGATTSDALLGAYSGTAIPPSLTSSTNLMLVEFKTNGNGNSKGWYAEYSTTSPCWCQGLKQMTDPSGTFTDGSSDFYYQSQATCMWRIIPPFADKITLTFNSFETEEGADKVTVYDGTTKIAQFSGIDIPGPVTATSGSMFITWTTNQSNNFQGWEAYYEVDNVGINEQAAVSNLVVYPNPASEKIHLSFRVEEKSQLQISLLNITGQTVYSVEQPAFTGLYQQDISVDFLPAGVYLLEIKTPAGITNRKIMVR